MREDGAPSCRRAALLGAGSVLIGSFWWEWLIGGGVLRAAVVSRVGVQP
jgi:hypothetical protein